MRSRMVVLVVLAVVLAVGAVALSYGTAQSQHAGQVIGTSAQTSGQLTDAELARENYLYVLADALQSMITPVASGALLTVVAILAMLARRAQLRRQANAR